MSIAEVILYDHFGISLVCDFCLQNLYLSTDIQTWKSKAVCIEMCNSRKLCILL